MLSEKSRALKPVVKIDLKKTWSSLNRDTKKSRLPSPLPKKPSRSKFWLKKILSRKSWNFQVDTSILDDASFTFCSYQLCNFSNLVQIFDFNPVLEVTFCTWHFSGINNKDNSNISAFSISSQKFKNLKSLECRETQVIKNRAKLRENEQKIMRTAVKSGSKILIYHCLRDFRNMDFL